MTAIVTKLNGEAQVANDYVDGFTAAGPETAAADGLTSDNDLTAADFTGLDTFEALED